ncbi:glycosyltransferase family 39 protein [Paenarthrobacter sp. PH39-S1]|uniref:glycosyltransferase family 39 protein n=1 Tax=Paenarthrobacter sp. PH39-S1 TaxID=3046204 RepID=UPI0024B9529A|nr:glycosyltransferase family 39 protein [Paenarthrobacter sp. PH39-S1]MDJ0356678.1 glycosyltransferase family 39 protein [Paenarthrobacter sp. PH39-S1]
MGTRTVEVDQQKHFELPLLARGPVLSAMVAVVVVLTVASAGYGYHRDELYFRMLDPAWGYVDQPPLTPLLVRLFTAVVADEAWAIRIPATLATAASVLALALITRELGGGRGAQGLCAWAYAFAAFPLLMGHVMLTSTIDLLVWPAVVLLVMRALLRNQPRWWYAAGLVVGLSMYNKLLIAALLVALAVGLLVAGPRRALWSKHVLAAVLVALVIGAPNLIYQILHGWPQLGMGTALARRNADEVRVQMWPFLLLLLGPPLVPIWVAGLTALIRRPQWRPVRCLAVAFPVLLVFTFVAGSQFYYPVGILSVLFAAGCVPAAQFTSRSARWWLPVLVIGIAVNAAVSAVLGLPVLPLSILGASPVPSVSQVAADQVGWPAYVGQVAAVYHGLSAADAGRAVIITSNYGEAGAIARYGPALGLPHPYSGHNELYFAARPPDAAGTAVVVGGQIRSTAQYFKSCTTVGTLDNGVDVDNEEQDQPVTLCHGLKGSWSTIWPAFQHFG